MTKVVINPGVCGFITTVTAVADEEDETELTVTLKSGCGSVREMMEQLGSSFNAYEECLVKPGNGKIYGYAAQHFPIHAACPVLSGIIKCMEAESGLALKRNASIEFVHEEE